MRLLFEDFPKNHNLVLIGRPNLLSALDLTVNHDIKSRVTHSVITKRLNSDDMRDFSLHQLDHVGLGHNTFTQPAIDLFVRSADGVLRKARNLCVACMIEAVRSANKNHRHRQRQPRAATASLAKRNRPRRLLSDTPLTHKSLLQNGFARGFRIDLQLAKLPTTFILETHMIPADLLRRLRNDLPTPVTIAALGRKGPPSKMSEGYFRFLCPNCSEMLATVNSKNKLAHCFYCHKNYNNIDLLLTEGYTFRNAVGLLESWLNRHQNRPRKTTYPADAPQ